MLRALLFVAIAVSQRSPGKRRAPGALLSMRFPGAAFGLTRATRLATLHLRCAGQPEVVEAGGGEGPKLGSEWTTPFPHR